MTPMNIVELRQRLDDACASGEKISLHTAAELLGMSPDSLRKSIYKGRCPFAVGYPPGQGENGFSVIPTLAFYNFMTQACS